MTPAQIEACSRELTRKALASPSMKLPNRSMAICLIIKKYVPWSSSRPP